MGIVKISFEKDDGTIFYTEHLVDILKITKGLPVIKWKKTGSLAALHKKYFSMLEELRKNTDAKNNYSKAEFPNSIKPLLFNYLQDFKHIFTTGVPEYSTKNLTVEGYSLLIEQLKVVAYDVFNYIFKKD